MSGLKLLGYSQAFIEGLIATFAYKGAKDCSANPKFPAASAGDLYIVSVAGKIGGALGTAVKVGDLLICNTDGTAEGTQAEVGSKWNVISAEGAYRPAGSLVFYETKNIVVPGLIAVPAGDTDYIPPVFLKLREGQTAKIVSCRYRLNSGTSAKIKLQRNGVDIAGFTGMVAKSTEVGETDPADVALADGDRLAVVVTEVTGSPRNMTVALVIEHTVA